MKVSIITITYNSSATVEDTLRTVVSQDYPDLEYIIIDGKSKDKTLEIVEKYKHGIAKVVSEKDKGLYDALNKGIKQATGDIIGMLHSDDLYANDQVISKVVKKFEEDPTIEGVYADLVFVNRNDVNKVMRTWNSGEYEEDAFVRGWMPPHPTFFVKKECYEKFGGFNTELKLSADYELMLRLIHKNKIKLAYLNEVIVKMRMGGVSNVSFFVKLKANIEDKMAWKLNGMKPGVLTMLMKPLRKIGQYFKRAYHAMF
ncbi:MAG TPA: glycosyltransferase family 2 protein [Bacteroidia bacterium]|jgi:glycosyltransferase involved in cell wall biosynthesis|nr:glycosyltransferase family 2 protein [Bacteroidia bacterium]HQF26965.1 glycosyltransferase family 2 protein [Bacteroidia bacterium]HQK96444.1 glycosyltransferase family 2 protein [Bacteroidia bacterium]